MKIKLLTPVHAATPFADVQIIITAFWTEDQRLEYTSSRQVTYVGKIHAYDLCCCDYKSFLASVVQTLLSRPVGDTGLGENIHIVSDSPIMFKHVTMGTDVIITDYYPRRHRVRYEGEGMVGSIDVAALPNGTRGSVLNAIEDALSHMSVETRLANLDARIKGIDARLRRD